MLSRSISNSSLDDVYAPAKQAGAIGVKLRGSGVYVEPYNQPAVKKALSNLQEVYFPFGNQGSESFTINRFNSFEVVSCQLKRTKKNPSTSLTI
jgi:galactokinase/mevalonate kinase-like predicted kinase